MEGMGDGGGEEDDDDEDEEEEVVVAAARQRGEEQFCRECRARRGASVGKNVVAANAAATAAEDGDGDAEAEAGAIARAHMAEGSWVARSRAVAIGARALLAAVARSPAPAACKRR
jgi:hypothetical protein